MSAANQPTPKAAATAAPENTLEVRKLSKVFGGLRAVNNMEFSIPKGALFGLIGPNGAGKTTVFNMITGVYEPTAGDVIFNGTNITGLEPHLINQMGIARTFQNIRLFQIGRAHV